MNEVFKVVVSLSLSGSLLIAALFLIRPLLKGRLSRQWQYYLWLIVIARLLLPFAPQENLYGGAIQALGRASMAADAALPSAAPPPAPSLYTPPVRAPRDARALTEILGAAWLAGALGLFLYRARGYRRFALSVRAGQTPLADAALLARLEAVKARMGVRGEAAVCVNPRVASPLLLGLFRPCIVLPDAGLSPEAFTYIAMHELTHFRRCDKLYQWLVQATVCLHWFNPLVHRMAREIGRDGEFSCDAALLSRLDAGGRRAYGRTLLEAMPRAGKSPDAALSWSGNKAILRERLCAIVTFQRMSAARAACCALLTALVAAAACFSGVYADTAAPPTVPSPASSATALSPAADAPDAGEAVVYEEVSLEAYESGLPYIHDVFVNRTERTITSVARGMLAFDSAGNPLAIDWLCLDSDDEPSYDYVYDWGRENLAPGGKDDVVGGWTLNAMGNDPHVQDIAYVLYEVKALTFSDGSTWENPGYEGWLAAYKGKAADTAVLESYYPHALAVPPSAGAGADWQPAISP